MDEPTDEQMKILREDIISGRVMIVEVEHYKRLTDNLDESYDAYKKKTQRIEELELAKTIGIQACDLLRERIKELAAIIRCAKPTSLGKTIREIVDSIPSETNRDSINQAADRLDVWWKYIKELEVALKEFGTHKPNCAYLQSLRGNSIEKCDCGLKKVLKCLKPLPTL